MISSAETPWRVACSVFPFRSTSSIRTDNPSSSCDTSLNVSELRQCSIGGLSVVRRVVLDAVSVTLSIGNGAKHPEQARNRVRRAVATMPATRVRSFVRTRAAPVVVGQSGDHSSSGKPQVRSGARVRSNAELIRLFGLPRGPAAEHLLHLPARPWLQVHGCPKPLS